MDTPPHEIARRQHGVVARTQLHAAGIVGARIDTLVRSRELHIAARGVYRVPGVPRDELTEPMTALLRCGPGARVAGERMLAAHGVAVPPLRPHVGLRFCVLVPAAERLPASQVWDVRPDRHPTVGGPVMVYGLATWGVARNLLEAVVHAPDARRVLELADAVVAHDPTVPTQLLAMAGRAPTHPGLAPLAVVGRLPQAVLPADAGLGFAPSAARRWGASRGGHTLAAPPPPTSKVPS